MSIKINEKKLQSLVKADLLSHEQAQKMWAYLVNENEMVAGFNLTHFFYYFGALVCILAMTWFMNLGWEQFGGAGLSIISSIYMLIFTLAGNKLWSQKGFQIPGGLLYTVAVCVTPLLCYGIQRWTGYWSANDPGVYRDYHIWVRSSWILMSLGTVLVGGIYLKNIPFPFLTMPISVALFYITMDIVPLIHGNQNYTEYAHYRELYSLGFGLILLIYSYALDRKEKVDYSFWLYLFGLMAFWGGLSSMNSDSEIGKFIYFLINLGLLFLALFLYRRVFMVFGGLGVMGYLWHLADKVFKDSLLFPFVMTLCGLAIMYLGVKYQKNKKLIDAKFSQAIPQGLQKFRPVEKS